jgi:hypothetical protein
VRVLVTLPWGQRLGGAEAMLQAVLDGAQASGHEFELVFFEDGPWPRELGEAGFRVDVLAAGRLREPHRWAATVWRLARIFRGRRPDVILNWSAKTQLYGSPAALLAGMADRVLWWQQSIPSRSWLDSVATLLPAAAVGCYSQAAAEAQGRLFPRRRTFVVAAGAPAPDPETGAGSALLRERGREMHLVIVGGDAYNLSAEYAASLPGLVASLGLTDAVTLTGQVPDAGPYIEQMDVLVNASDPEPFGIVLLEGMARGVAVVAVDSGGPAEFIEDGTTGVLARTGEPEALAEALEILLDSPALRRTMGERGRDSFNRSFTDLHLRERFFANLEARVSERIGSK